MHVSPLRPAFADLQLCDARDDLVGWDKVESSSENCETRESRIHAGDVKVDRQVSDTRELRSQYPRGKVVTLGFGQVKPASRLKSEEGKVAQDYAHLLRFARGGEHSGEKSTKEDLVLVAQLHSTFRQDSRFFWVWLANLKADACV